MMINLQMYISKLYHSLHTYRHQQAIMLAVFITITRPLLEGSVKDCETILHRALCVENINMNTHTLVTQIAEYQSGETGK